MDRNLKIVRVWGTADGYSLEFNHKKGDEWTSDVPIDMSDGKYICLFYALAENNRIGVWSGILYISNGFACLHLDVEKFVIELLPPIEPRLLVRYVIELLPECPEHDHIYV